MSDVGENMIPGGWSATREPTKEDQDILDKVKEQYEKKTGTIPRKFLAVLVRTQIVVGMNYLFKVDIGEKAYKRLLVYVPLPGQGEPVLVAILPDKTPDDKLEDF